MTTPDFTPPSEHNIRADGPAPRFMQGALLGNGGLGVVVNTRPDAVVLRLGHNDVWDERIDESHAETVLTFDEVFARVRSASEAGSPEDDPWFADYRRRMEEPYGRPYPRPYPCGQLVLGIDRRRTRVLGHELELANGVCHVFFEHDGRRRQLDVVVDPHEDVIVARMVDSADAGDTSPIERLRLIPDPLGPIGSGGGATAAELAISSTIAGEIPLREQVTEIDAGTRGIAFAEVLPARSASAADQHRLIVALETDAELSSIDRPSWYGGRAPTTPLERGVSSDRLEIRVTVVHDRDPIGAVASLPGDAAAPESWWPRAYERSATEWTAYWGRSRVRLASIELERTWYRNTYFIHCALRAGRTAPGLFGNWSSGEVGTAWHGDYHMNYNTQQLFWGVFSSNRVESHEPYIALVNDLMPLASRWAKDYFGLPGAYFPHSAYPVPMTTMPFPSPIWGWEISETPWTVQSLWWHFLYTQDRAVLERDLIGPLEAATDFLVAYLRRDDAEGERWGDERRHIFPTVVPEMYGLTEGLTLNADCIADLTLTRFLFRSYLEAVEVLEPDAERQDRAARVAELLELLPEYPTASTPDGDVFVSVPGEDPDVVYNIPLAGMTVFPGEEHSWQSSPDEVELATRSIRRQRVEGGNELVFLHLQAARMGILDPEVLLAQLRYCELPNGTLTDMVLQANGRYADTTPFEFMAEMGVFVENFAITAVINELLMQGSTGVIRVFPNAIPLGDAEFHGLRAPGGFLVSAAALDGECQWIEVTCESGGELRLQSPWHEVPRVIGAGNEVVFSDGIARIAVSKGEKILLTKSDS